MNEFKVRYSPPSKYDSETYGTIVQVVNDDKTFECYIQVSSEVDQPRWEPLGSFLAFAFKDLLHNPNFVAECLRLYNFETQLDIHDTETTRSLAELIQEVPSRVIPFIKTACKEEQIV